MPVRRKKDAKGSYYQWGSGAKYYFDPKNPTTRVNARNRAQQQGRAAYAHGYKK